MAHCIHFMILRVWFCALLDSNCKFHYFRGGFFRKVILKNWNTIRTEWKTKMKNSEH